MQRYTPEQAGSLWEDEQGGWVRFADALADREVYAEERVKQEREEMVGLVQLCDQGEPGIYGAGVHAACSWIIREIRSRGAAPAEAKRPCARCGWPYCQDEAWSQCPNCDAKPGPTPKHIEPPKASGYPSWDEWAHTVTAAVNRMQGTP